MIDTDTNNELENFSRCVNREVTAKNITLLRCDSHTPQKPR